MSADLPPRWSEATLGDLIDGFQAGRNLKANGHRASPGQYGVLKISAVTWGEFNPAENKALAPSDSPKPHEIVRAGDLLITRANTSELVGAVVRVEEDHPMLMLPDKILRLVVNERKVDPDFLKYALRTGAVREHFEREATGTSDSMRNLSQPKMCAAPIQLAPRGEQRRIVERIEALTVKSRRAKEALDAIPPLLERFRQSVLAAAFRGDLTKDWREQNPDVEPADQLLARIRQERRARWEQAELEKLRTQDRTPRNHEWKKKYVEPEPVDADELAQLPLTWGWACLDLLTFIKGGITKGEKVRPGERYETVQYLRVANVQRGYLDLAHVAEIDARASAAAELALRNGDVLFTEGGDRDKLGRGWVWHAELPHCIHQNHIFRARPASAEIVPELISWYGNLHGRSYFTDEGKQTTNLASISMTKLSRFPIPVMPATEQTIVHARIQARLRTVAALGERLRAAAETAQTLDVAILAKAFRGEL